MFTFDDFMAMTREQIFGIMDGVRLEPEERTQFNRACSIRKITWNDYADYELAQTMKQANR